MANIDKLYLDLKEAESEYKSTLKAYYTNYCEAYKESLSQQRLYFRTRGKLVGFRVGSVMFDPLKGWLAAGEDENGKLTTLHVSKLVTCESGIIGKPEHLSYYGPVCLEQIYSF